MPSCAAGARSESRPPAAPTPPSRWAGAWGAVSWSARPGARSGCPTSRSPASARPRSERGHSGRRCYSSPGKAPQDGGAWWPRQPAVSWRSGSRSAVTDEFQVGHWSQLQMEAMRETTEKMTEQTTTDRSRWIALYVLCAGVLMIVLDVTVVNVALPSIQTDLGFSQSSLAWVVNAYLISFGGLLLLAGRFGDILGRGGIFLAGLALFTVASLACGLAGSEGLLGGAPFVQGSGGGGGPPAAPAPCVTTFSP